MTKQQKLEAIYEAMADNNIYTLSEIDYVDDHNIVHWEFDSDDDYHYLLDEYWELIEESKEDWLIQDTNGNLTKSDSFRTPKQGDKVQVGEVDGFWYDTLYEFVCLYGDRVLVREWLEFELYDKWRFPQEEVTLLDGKTYLVEERGGEKILKLKN